MNRTNECVTLLAEKERLETLGNNLPNGVLYQFVLDVQTGQMRITFVSGKWEEIIGISKETAMNNIEIFLAMIHPDDLPYVMHEIDKSAQTMNDFYVEFPINVQGSIRWLQISSHPNRSDGLIVWDGIMLDTTFRKEAERELKTEKMRLQALGDNLPGSTLYQLSRDKRTGQMRILYVSGTWEAVTGIAAEDALADILIVFDAVDPGYLPALIRSIEDSARTMTDHIHETLLGDRWIHIIARPRYEGTLIIWDSIMTNITERKNNEAELAQYREKLEYLVQERTDELNTANEELYASNEALYVTNEELNKYKAQLEEMVVQKTLETTQSLQAMRAVLDNIDFHIFVTNFEDDKILFANQKTKELFGDVVGQTCWKVIQKGMTAPCDFCPKHHLLDEHNRPTGIHQWEQKNLHNNEWYFCRDAAVEWIDGRLVHLEYATNITGQKNKKNVT